ncbi:MAG: DUF362 domain-containing protein [Desulfatiglans sp.]|jgi:uncharacterized protein (DUF362 family)/Pyruvate/2-oxoacid:ferredoxin oxidoreductase delta subunit|nr:DUF362 domain-containing protein [Thermodesulfobacteriota bacterium]MEE4354334.1 DUF362 domain-containing protein [Desulfatiglans sp.]
MLTSKVVLVKCDSYEEARVYEAVEQGFHLLGGVTEFVKSGERITLKPNILVGSNPEKSVTTHPSVLKAVGKLIKQAGGDVYYGDSSALGKCEGNAKRAGLKEAGDEIGIALADFDNGQTVSHREARLVKQFVIANGVMESDGLVSLPKLKSHALTRLTGAVKNQFGCIPGTLKSQFHVKLPDPGDFATMLVDLNTLIQPRLFIMDGIVAMEGNGPRSGKPKKLNVLLFSVDPVALDAIACRIVDLDPEYVPTSRPGEEAGLGTYHYENIDIIGEPVEMFIDEEFEVVRRSVRSVSGGRIRKYLRNRMCPRPTIDKEKCTLCGTCVSLCPADPKAVNWHSGDKSNSPSFKYDQCIRCFCCQEMCPDGAIDIKTPLLGKVLFR